MYGYTLLPSIEENPVATTVVVNTFKPLRAAKRKLVARVTPLLARVWKGCKRLWGWIKTRYGRIREKLRKKETVTWDERLPKARSKCFNPTREVRCQSQSMFFGKLPLELRRMVYEFMSGELVKLSEIDCESLDRDRIYNHQEVCYRIGVGPFKSSCPMLLKMLAFPRSCKMAQVSKSMLVFIPSCQTDLDHRYQEALPYVYTSNTFYIPDMTAFFCFHRYLPPPRRHTITSLHLRWAYKTPFSLNGSWLDMGPHNDVQWKRTWAEIALMKSLKHIRVDIIVACPYGPRTHYENHCFFPMLKEFPEPGRIEVYVSWDEESVQEGQPARDWPFKVMRGTFGCKKRGHSPCRQEALTTLNDLYIQTNYGTMV